jgi:hypothetical protein
MVLTIPMQRRTVHRFQRIEARPLGVWQEKSKDGGCVLLWAAPHGGRCDQPPERMLHADGLRELANCTVGLVGRRGEGDDRSSMGWGCVSVDMVSG